VFQLKIFDSSSIILFFKEANKPLFLYRWILSGYSLKIPQEVFNEIQHEALTISSFQKQNSGQISIIEPFPLENKERLQNLYPNLGPGEIETIALGIKYQTEKKRYYCILDDSNARKAAKFEKIIFTGSIGLLIRMYQKNLMSKDELKEMYLLIKNSKFRIDEKTLGLLINV
jgi:predicted nucleic acid-binding protein